MKSLEHRLLMAFEPPRNHLRAHKFSERHLKPGEVALARVLSMCDDREKGLRASELARELGVSRQTLSFLLSSMEGAGYIHREMGQKDRRTVYIKLTGKGLKEYEKLVAHKLRMMKIMAERMGVKDTEALIALLQRATEIFNEVTEEEIERASDKNHKKQNEENK